VALEQVAIAVERCADRRVAEPLLDLFGVPPLAGEDRGASVAEVVEAQALRHRRIPRRGPKVPDHEVVVTDRTASGRGEDVAIARGVVADVLTDHVGKESWEAHRAPVARLGRTDHEFASNLGE
jgi:hypothetical protein